MSDYCDEAALTALVGAIERGERDEIAQIDRLLNDFPGDPRLHFLRGSMLAGIGRPIEALAALQRAVAIAPDFAIARFQLGFFQLTSGEAAAALGTWGPLALLPHDHYLRRFVGGLTHLIRDEFTACLPELTMGMAANDENPPLNRDITLIVDRVRQIVDDAPPSQGEAPDEGSATSFLLGQFGGTRGLY